MNNNGKNHKNGITVQSKLLVDIFLNPFTGITERYKRLKLNPKYGNTIKNLLISQGLIQPRNIITGKGWITLFDLTQKGRIVLRDLDYEEKFISEGIIHKFWKLKISEYYMKKNLEVMVEKNINGRPDLIVINGDKKTAVEIETGKSNYIANIQRALEAGFDEIICVATNKHVEEKIREELDRKNIVHNKLKVTSVFTFDIS